MRRTIIFIFCFFTFTAYAQQKKVALIIGNGEYSNYFKQLRTSVNDANGMNWTLQALGFETIMGTDCDRDKMTDLLKQFQKKARGADVALFYYSGHGGHTTKEKYFLVPSGAYDNSATFATECLDFEAVEESMKATGAKLKLFFIDACRNSLNGSKGWISYKPEQFINKDNEATGTAWYFGTSNTAYVGNSDFSVFTQALLNHIGDSEYFNVIWERIYKEILSQYPEQKPFRTNDANFKDFILNPSGVSIGRRVPYGQDWVNIKSYPANADIKLNKKSYGNSTRVLLRFDTKYDIDITADGYKTYHNSISISPYPNSQRSFVYNLTKLDSVVLTVTSNVKDATVYIDNKYSGSTGCELNTLSGAHELKVEKKGYYSKTIALNLDKKNNQQHIDLSRELPWFFEEPDYYGFDAGTITYHFSPKYQIGLSYLHRLSRHHSIGIMLGTSIDYFSQLQVNPAYHNSIYISSSTSLTLSPIINNNIKTETKRIHPKEYSDEVDPFNEAKHYDINNLILAQYGYSPCEGITIDLGIGAARHTNKHYMENAYYIETTIVTNMQTGEVSEPTYKDIKGDSPFFYEDSNIWSPALRLGSLFFIPVGAWDISIILGGGYTYLPMNHKYSSWDVCLGVFWEFGF